ncbi:MAG TPA: CDP-2,3-bis-(O-geranylgeranyl)-sn-glycerol synthase [Candidatus Korarchaeota archaeon]|nr:CDP-2,3-bis-(O-geranylgeranyl)-sn-glycerol synthase [Candidatus Korarchaeota archaeon]HDI74262.1 CDP-2,3-bis-(O-geranylgeranyl)-sn-glycerol synthase [Candidatus Korarchaeota archaeon]
MSDVLGTAIRSIWYILPSYVANMTPVIFGGGRPLDLNKKFIDGRRILGDHKTIRGFISGLITGTLVGCMQGRPLTGFLLSLGTMVGDSFGSFVKRRMGIEAGGSAPLLDQEGFLIFSILFTYPLEPLSLDSLIFLLLITPVLHKATNMVAYHLKLKGVSH